MSLDEYILTTKKANSKKIYKIQNIVRQRTIYYWAKHNNWLLQYNISEELYAKVIRLFGEAIADSLSKGINVILPEHMGELYLTKYKPLYKIVDGKVKVSLAIDWPTTLKLWYEDLQSREAKVLIKKPSDYVYKLLYNKVRAEFKNKLFYTFRFMRSLKSKLSNNIKEGIVDASIEL